MVDLFSVLITNVFVVVFDVFFFINIYIIYIWLKCDELYNN